MDRRTRWSTTKREIQSMSDEFLKKFYEDAVSDYNEKPSNNIENFIKWSEEEIRKRDI